MPVVDAQARIVAAEAMTNGRGVDGPKGSISGASTYKPPGSKGSARGVLTDHPKHRRRLRWRISRCCTRWRRPSGVTPSGDFAARRLGTSPSNGVGTDELVWKTSVSRSWAPAWSLHDRAVPRPTTAPARSPSSHGTTSIRPRARHVQRTSELLRRVGREYAAERKSKSGRWILVLPDRQVSGRDRPPRPSRRRSTNIGNIRGTEATLARRAP